MQRLMTVHNMKRICCVTLVMGTLVFLTGCEEANIAIDFIIGHHSPALSNASQLGSPPIVLAATRSPGESPPPGPAVTPSVQPESRPAPVQVTQEGKRRDPGRFPPGVSSERPEEKRVKDMFSVDRDPFRPPTEILPTECPPSMPLCRFDRSQLKLVGVIQVGDGQFKAMVEDPDGRGYFVTPGMQIGGATVTQVSNRGVTLYVHKTRQDVVMPLYRESREASEL